MDKRKTQFDIVEIIKRCIVESVEVGYAKRVGPVAPWTMIVNEEEFAKHISRAIMQQYSKGSP